MTVHKSSFLILEKHLWILMALCLLPWLIVQSQLSINGDTAWLITSAKRLLAGGLMSTDYYETNPPLSILYHLPPVWLEKILPLPDYTVIFLYFLTLIAIATYTTHAVLKYWPCLTIGQRYSLTAGFIAGSTIMVAIAIGEREHIIFLGLMPFLLAQLSLTWGYSLPKKLLWFVMALGTFAVLLKPHYGLLPTIFLIHRMIDQKRFWSIIRDPDFLALSIGTVSYIGCVWFFFHDYITVILPDAVTLYISNKNYSAALPELFLHSTLFLVFMAIEFFFTPLEGKQKKLLMLLYAGALLCLIPYAVQMKGFFYQLIPAMGFFFCAISFSLQSYTRQYIKNDTLQVILTLLMIFILAYASRPLLIGYPTHKDFSSLPLSQAIADCEKPCSYFIFNDNMEIMHPTAFYDGQSIASRFPTYWFLPALVQAQYNIEHNLPSSLTHEELTHYKTKYGQMTAEDLKNYRPKMLIIGQFILTPDQKIFDFADFFATVPAFQTEWQQYRKDRTITINRRPYFTGTAMDEDFPITYDIYYRSE